MLLLNKGIMEYIEGWFHVSNRMKVAGLVFNLQALSCNCDFESKKFSDPI